MGIPFKNLPWGKIISGAGTVVTAVVAVAGALSEDKKNREFEQLKKDVSELKKGQN